MKKTTKAKPLPPQELLLHLFTYNRRTGVLRWKNPPARSKAVAGDIVESVFASGYLRVMINKQTYRVHLVIWKMVMGRDAAFTIDHRDGVKKNNKWANLREATYSENVANMGLTSRNTSGFKGVSRVPCGKWKASVRFRGRLIYLGHHDTPDKAHEAYRLKAAELFGKFARVK